VKRTDGETDARNLESFVFLTQPKHNELVIWVSKLSSVPFFRM